jgi:hypothetical protein
MCWSNKYVRGESRASCRGALYGRPSTPTIDTPNKNRFSARLLPASAFRVFRVFYGHLLKIRFSAAGIGQQFTP